MDKSKKLQDANTLSRKTKLKISEKLFIAFVVLACIGLLFLSYLAGDETRGFTLFIILIILGIASLFFFKRFNKKSVNIILNIVVVISLVIAVMGAILLVVAIIGIIRDVM